MAVRAVIVEDEPVARQTLRELAGAVPWLRVVGEAADGRSAVELLDRETPDLVFLDVQLPELSGLEVLARARHRPAVVFTTAFDRYAVTAFELEALDYLVKPFGRRRFAATMARVRRRLEEGEAVRSLPAAAREALGEVPLERLFAHQGSRIVPLPVDSVVRFEGCDDYVRVHTGEGRYLVDLTLDALEARLDPACFWRIHRSHILNLDQVSSFTPHADGRRLVVALRDGSRIVASRRSSQRLKARLNAQGG